MRKFILAFTLLLGFTPLHASKQLAKPHVIFEGYMAGMFSLFDQVLSLLDSYERGLISGCEVDFGDEGVYYDPALGPNWWDYFCEPIKLESMKMGRVVKTKYVAIYAGAREIFLTLDRQQINALFKKYLVIRPAILEKINDYARNNFSNEYVIGIHYRGTDKHLEAPRVPYESVREAVDKALCSLSPDVRTRIFIATDEWAFVDYMVANFSIPICYYQGSPRAIDSQPVHLNSQFSAYDRGESALIDCALLSRCQLLIRCSSNLSRWSTYLNPEIPVVELNTGYYY